MMLSVPLYIIGGALWTWFHNRARRDAMNCNLRPSEMWWSFWCWPLWLVTWAFLANTNGISDMYALKSGKDT